MALKFTVHMVGYLVDQFLWRETNHRSDKYGGNVYKRTQFAKEVIEACCKSITESSE